MVYRCLMRAGRVTMTPGPRGCQGASPNLKERRAVGQGEFCHGPGFGGRAAFVLLHVQLSAFM